MLRKLKKISALLKIYKTKEGENIMTVDIYKNAYKEVYVILQNLVEEDYNKIPKEIIELFEKNKNDEHEFVLDKDLELKEQNLLPETRAILFNLFKDYLSESWQREKIIKWQNEERQKNEKLKKEKYNPDVFKKRNSNTNILKNLENKKDINQKNYQLIKHKENILIKIINSLKNFFKRKNK